ncbi:MAG TPA: ATP-binding cassette domain-containing protein [Bacteroidota bacterium]|nr:ATP-binding cassette domain-containing protein [Bacteroidota bacterium]
MSIQVSNLSKYYGDTRAVDDISFEVHSGEILGFLGPNGAGKTTSMRVITCYLPPSGGTVKVEGRDIVSESLEVRKLVGYLPEQNPLYLDMNVSEYLDYSAQLQGVESRMVPRRRREMIDVCGLGEMMHKDIGQLSKGYRQRVGLAAAMIHDPKVLILDEPTSGLDPNQIVEIRTLIHNLGTEKTVVLSTHILPEVQATCTRVIIINRGKIVADASIDDLHKGMRGGDKIILEVRAPESDTPQTIAAVLRNIPQVESAVLTGETDRSMKFTVGSARATDIRADLFRLCVEKGWVALELRREQTSLEDIFRELTMQS